MIISRKEANNRGKLAGDKLNDCNCIYIMQDNPTGKDLKGNQGKSPIIHKDLLRNVFSSQRQAQTSKQNSEQLLHQIKN